MPKVLIALLALTLPVCSQTVWRLGDVNADVVSASSVPWSYYTHIEIYGLNCNGSGSLANVTGYNTANWPSYRSAATSNGVKLMLLVGGDMTTCTNGSNLSTFVSKIAGAIKGTDTSLNTKGVAFDGVDLDWEANFSTSLAGQYESLISGLRSALGSGKLITVDGWRAQMFANVILNQVNNIDRFNNEMYDSAASYNGASNSSGQQWSWYNMANNSPTLNSGSAEGSANWYVQQGFPMSKINEGIPLYGYVYSGCTHSEVVGCSVANNNQYGYKAIKSNSTWWNSPHLNDATNGADYIQLSSSNEYITYTDTTQIGQLVTWGKANGLGGYFTWELGDENLNAGSQAANFPLSSALYTDVTGGTSSCAITTSSPLPSGTVGTAYGQQLSQTSCPSSSFTLTSGALPAGLSLNASGLISGTPSASGTFSFTVTYGSAAKVFSITITPSCSITTTSPLPGGTAGSAYSVTLAQTGCTGSWSASGLPGGLLINSSTGVISGTPTTPGNYSVIASIAGKTKTLSLTVAAVGGPSSYAGITFAGTTIQ